MKHTEKLSKILQGFELYLLPFYDDVMEHERSEAEEYDMDITYQDNEADFYAWVDSLSWEELLVKIEDYKLL